MKQHLDVLLSILMQMFKYFNIRIIKGNSFQAAPRILSVLSFDNIYAAQLCSSIPLPSCRSNVDHNLYGHFMSFLSHFLPIMSSHACCLFISICIT